MHKFSTAATKSSALPVLRSVGLLNVPYSTFAGASVARLVRSALSSLRDKNLCINRASAEFFPDAKDEILVLQQPAFFPLPKKRGKLPDDLIFQWNGTLDVGLLEKTLREIKVGKILKDEEGGENEDSSKSKRNSQITASWIVSHWISSCSGPSPFW